MPPGPHTRPRHNQYTRYHHRRRLPQVQYLDKPQTFTAEQLMAMLLVDLKEIAEADGVAVSEAVLSVPTYYTEPERHAMLAAAQVGGVAGRDEGGARGLAALVAAQAQAFGVAPGWAAKEQGRAGGRLLPGENGIAAR